MAGRDIGLDKESASIHYLWVGPPPEAKAALWGKNLPGHDIAGPIAMAQANKINPIEFWCLDAHVSFYSKKLKDKGIKVCSIEHYIEFQIKNSRDGESKERAEKMNKILKESLRKSKDGRNISIRDLVTIKDAFSLFLHATKSDQALFTLDTNVMPADQKISFPAEEKFIVPLVDFGQEQIDCWAIYSSKNNKIIPTDAFDDYFAKWDDQARKAREKYGSQSPQYEGELGAAILSSLDEAMDRNLNFSSQWQAETIDLNSCLVRELGVKKTYNNSHRFLRESESVLISEPSSPETEDSDDEIQIEQKKPSISYTDRCNAKIFVDVLKQYIISHEWKLNGGGKKIKFEGKEVTVPNTVYAQWQIIQDAQAQEKEKKGSVDWEEVHYQIKTKAKESLEQPKKEGLFSSFGKRDPDTIEYLEKCSQLSATKFMEHVRSQEMARLKARK